MMSTLPHCFGRARTFFSLAAALGSDSACSKAALAEPTGLVNRRVRERCQNHDGVPAP